MVLPTAPTWSGWMSEGLWMWQAAELAAEGWGESGSLCSGARVCGRLPAASPGSITGKQGVYLALADLVSSRLSAALCLCLIGFNFSTAFTSKQYLLVEKTTKHLLWGAKNLGQNSKVYWHACSWIPITSVQEPPYFEFQFEIQDFV